MNSATAFSEWAYSVSVRRGRSDLRYFVQEASRGGIGRRGRAGWLLNVGPEYLGVDVDDMVLVGVGVGVDSMGRGY